MTICVYRMVEFMKQTADKEAISWQPEILTAGGTNTAGVQRMGKQGAIALLKACLEQIDGYDWKH